MPASPFPASRTLTGIAMAVSGWAVFSAQDAIVKWLVVKLPVPEVLFARSVVVAAVASFALRRADLAALAQPRHVSAIVLRAILILAARAGAVRGALLGAHDDPGAHTEQTRQHGGDDGEQQSCFRRRLSRRRAVRVLPGQHLRPRSDVGARPYRLRRTMAIVREPATCRAVGPRAIRIFVFALGDALGLGRLWRLARSAKIRRRGHCPRQRAVRALFRKPTTGHPTRRLIASASLQN
jgi:hypothetical protein